MRPNRLVVGSVLTAALALVALPGLAGSRAPSPLEQVPVGAFQPISIPAPDRRSTSASVALDGAHRSDGSITADALILDPPETEPANPTERASKAQAGPRAGSVRKPSRSTLTGYATFYDHGTTAMRLPRGTVVVICGKGGCIERVVNDYGPQKPSRIVDLYRPDFFKICGCEWFAGTTEVTVYVY